MQGYQRGKAKQQPGGGEQPAQFERLVGEEKGLVRMLVEEFPIVAVEGRDQRGDTALGVGGG